MDMSKIIILLGIIVITLSSSYGQSNSTWDFKSCTLNDSGDVACANVCQDGWAHCTSQRFSGGVERHVCNCDGRSVIEVPFTCQLLEADSATNGALECRHICKSMTPQHVGADCLGHCGCIHAKYVVYRI